MALEIKPAAPAAPAVDAARTERVPEPGPKESVPHAAAEQLAREKAAQVAEADRHRRREAGNAIRQTRLDISVSDDGELLVKVRDARTDKVVRTIPPDELVEFGRKLKQYQGLLLDRRG